jgi:phosphoribosylaminoimidazolecarboxamide formyltransferase/IMP cyclohydrolase
MHIDELKKKENIALLSVYNKKGIANFARELDSLNWGIIASGGTAKELSKEGIPVCDVSELVGGGAILGHRVVTLSREVHAGLLAQDKDTEELKDLGILKIDLVCVDLYPLEDEIIKAESTDKSVIEQTDIGGPTILRSATKGQRIVICDSVDRMRIIDWLKQGQPDKSKTIKELAAKAEKLVANYCLISARYHSNKIYDGLIGEQMMKCKYGENAWQEPAGLYSTNLKDPLSLDKFQLVCGDSPSFNNLVDIERLLQTITHIAAVTDINKINSPYIALACKHGNPCGASVGSNKIEVLKKMISGDTKAIFGGLVMTNFKIDARLAETLLSHLVPKGQRRLLDGIIAPSFDDKAMEALKRKKDKCRFLANPDLGKLSKRTLNEEPRLRQVRGGFLKQPNYTFVMNFNNPGIEKFGQATKAQEKDLLLAWAIGSTSNSNTITLVRDGSLIGNGVGQQDRVGCCKLAILRTKDAGHEVEESVAYSDSFFPFDDGPKVLAKAGIKAILASSGSVNDEKVASICRKYGIKLYLIPDKIGRGFFGH